MSSPLSKVFGIDLGTTYSCIAYVDEHGKPAIIPNFDNNRVTPSVVFFDDDNIVVGEEAKNSIVVHPERVVSFIKRDMGNPHFLFEYDGTPYKPEEISGYILRKLVKDAEEKLGEEIKDVVITCPAYFGINEREATRLAGEIAGLNVKNIINEPTAAAISYGMDAGENKVVLVYDLGGGTFDVTMIEIKPEAIKVIVTGGDHELGGKDWDDKVINYLVECYNQETGTDEDILADLETYGELRLSAEKAKKTLTQRDKTVLSVVHAGEKVKVELAREKFEELTADLMERTIALTRALLDEARKKGQDNFDEIILVGGSTRMPQVKEWVDREFSCDAKIFDPDESVAKGAAVFGWKTSLNDELVRRVAQSTGQDEKAVKLDEVSQETIQKIEQEVADDTGLTLGEVKKARTEIFNVTSKSFGILAYDGNNEKILSNLILKNETVPSEITRKFGTREDNQSNVKLEIMESLSTDQKTSQKNGTEIGTAVMNLPPGLPAQSPIEITFRINEEGRLDVQARELTSGREVETSVETTSVISGEALEEAKERSKGIVVL
ncbi:MAG: Hsp70 family protein [Phaeodactylibacter sp.]|nr:Hsp70 family protein [Phaeodactylibacter sp.]